MNSVYATVIISEWPLCEPAPVGGARLLSRPGRLPPPPVRNEPCCAGPQLRFWLSAMPLGCGLQLHRTYGQHAEGRRAASRRQLKTPRPGADKKPPPVVGAPVRSGTHTHNAQLSGCDLNILWQDPGSTPAPVTTFQKIVKNQKV